MHRRNSQLHERWECLSESRIEASASCQSRIGRRHEWLAGVACFFDPCRINRIRRFLVGRRVEAKEQLMGKCGSFPRW